MASANHEPNELFRAARTRKNLSRTALADAANQLLPPRHLLTAGEIGRIERGSVHWPRAPRRAALRTVLGVDTDADIGLSNRRRRPTDTCFTSSSSRETSAPDCDIDAGRAVERRTLLRGSAFGAALGLAASVLTLDDLSRIRAAERDARRYLDVRVVDYLTDLLNRCAVDDGRQGPRRALPGVLGILSVVQGSAHEVKSSIRRPLLSVGARAAEFAGWLYRDAGFPEAAEYWRDRAGEWSMEARDYTMSGYLLIKKSQAAWDDRDAPRMLGLAQAVQHGPWRLPVRVRAEAVQQEARGLAMLDGDLRVIEDKLVEARDLLAEDAQGLSQRDVAMASHYGASLFRIQMAICYAEAGEVERAVSLFCTTLSPGAFSTRDHAYFVSLQAQALTAARRPDQAATAGIEALPVALAADSVRTVRELVRLRNQLGPWRHRPTVKSFDDMMVGAVSRL